MIRKISSADSEYIKSQQYINNTYTITKELVENSLDSGASIIKIVVDDDLIKVDDNGSGIDNLDEIGNPGFTSKDSTTYYVLGLNTDSSNLYCGYRGLALCSIKNMCNLEITTKHSTSNVAYKKSFSEGKIIQSAREKGTTVTVSNIFENCPIRRSLNKKNLSKDVKRITSLIESYSMVYQITFLLKFKGKTLLNKTGHNSLYEYCKYTYQNIFQDSLCKDTTDFFLFMLPNPETKDLSKIFYRKRYVTSKKISKEMKNVFNLYHEGFPLFILELKCDLDFNISPDKSEILFENEKEIIEQLKKTIREYFSNQIYCVNKTSGEPNNNYELSTEIPTKTAENITETLQYIEESDISIKEVSNKTEGYQNLIENFIDEDFNTKHDVSDTYKENIEREISDITSINSQDEEISDLPSMNKINSQDGIPLNKDKISDVVSSQDEEISDTVELKENIRKRNLPQTKNLFLNSPIFKKFCKENDEFTIPNTEISGTSDKSVNKRDHLLDSPMSDIVTPMKLSETVFDYIKTSPSPDISVRILKKDFYKMKIIGQFNKGFILATLIKDSKKYLLIIDQHASDEIYNYETLKNTTKIIKQKLLVPLDLQLSPIDELFVQENLNIFSKYGYEIKDNKLFTIPIIKGEEFGIKDFQDLLDNIKNEDEESMDKIHKLMATKACRMSVMIGEHLQISRLEKIVQNLGTLERPWKCPHGRPTFMIVEEIY